MKHIERFIALLMLLGAIGFNLWLYRAEPTAKIDPNDNAFQYALVDRTNQIWDWADRTCPNNVSRITCHVSLLIDHWVPNWAEGYNLPYYYSHVPQIIIVGSYRFIHWLSQFEIFNLQFLNDFKFQSASWRTNLKLFEYYHFIIYLLLCFFPLSVFLSMRVLKLPWLTAGIAALLASQISTDGLYGIDPSSFLWRGWGLSSQLFAMIFMPLALAFMIRVVNESGGTRLGIPIEHPQSRNLLHISLYNLKKIFVWSKNNRKHLESVRDEDVGWGMTRDRTREYFFAILFTALTTMGHLGLGLMLFLALPVIACTRPLISFLNQESLKTIFYQTKVAMFQTLLLAIPPIVILSYWIIPTLLGDAYHNISFWDPIWKFNSYGVKEVLTNLWNGYLFDWGRLPIFTGLVCVGFFTCLNKSWWVARIWGSTSSDQNNHQNKRAGSFKNFLRLHFLFRRKPMEKTVVGTEVRKNFLCDLSAPEIDLTPLPFLFLFFLFLYFGNTTWKGLLNIIPSMNEFHQHRFIVGVHLIGLFLAPIGATYLIQLFLKGGASTLRWVARPIQIGFTLFFLFIILPLLYKQTINYGTYNEILINQANDTFAKQQKDADLLVTTLKNLMQENPGRVYAGRGGNWGKTFQVAETSYLMYLSTYGIPTVLWLPETWSNNSDTEQYFSEDVPDHYSLYNIRYVAAPPDVRPQPFWTLVKETGSWKLYEIQLSEDRGQTSEVRNQKTEIRNQTSVRQLADQTSDFSHQPSDLSYITTGSSPSIVFSDKRSFANVVRLWIQSPFPGKAIYPQLALSSQPSAESSLPYFSMRDEATYQTPDNTIHSLFKEPPVYMTPWEYPQAFSNPKSQIPNPKEISNFNPPAGGQISNYIDILSQSSDSDMVFRAKVRIAPPSSDLRLPTSATCPTCVVVLKQTYHPNWRVTVKKLSNQSSTNEPQTMNSPLATTNYTPISVFPSFVAVRLEQPGTYEVVFSYTPSPLKLILLIAGFIIGITGIISYLILTHRTQTRKKIRV